MLLARRYATRAQDRAQETDGRQSEGQASAQINTNQLDMTCLPTSPLNILVPKVTIHKLEMELQQRARQAERAKKAKITTDVPAIPGVRRSTYTANLCSSLTKLLTFLCGMCFCVFPCIASTICPE